MSMTAPTPPEPDTTVVAALRRLNGRATLGDVVSETGIPRDQAETSLKQLMETCRGHLEVSDAGELLYHFDPRLIARDHEGTAARVGKAAWAAFKAAFKVWTAVMLVVYFVVFVVLIVVAMTANRGRDGYGGRRGGGIGLGDVFLIRWLLGGRAWRRGGHYYGSRHAKRLPKEAQPPFYKKVFAFIFGPEEPRPSRRQKDRSTIQLIRARNGVVTTAELVEHTALPLPEAEEEMARLTGAYGGDPRVSDKGEVVYAFPDLMKSASGKVRIREPKPAWLRLEHPKNLTGNTGTFNAVITGMNSLNLVAGSVIGLAPVLASARVGFVMVDPLIFYGLGVVPVVFSSLFFAIPLLRAWGVMRENGARRRRNIRRLLVGLVYGRSVGAVKWVSVGDAIRHVGRRLRDSDNQPGPIVKELEALASEFGADTEAGDGGFRYRFQSIHTTFVESELMRRELKLQDQKLGEIVYATSDTAEQAAQRDMAAFDRELARAQINLSRYLPSPNRVGYEEDFEVVEAEGDPGRVSLDRGLEPTGRRRPRVRR